MKKLKMFTLVHEHKTGTTTYLFESNSTVKGLMKNVYSVCQIIGIDFDDARETITFDEAGEIKTVIL